MKKYSNILCFDKTTSIKTIRGMLKIKDIKPGDYIVSYDDELKDKCIDTVMCTAESIHDICAIVVFDNGTRLKATVDHPLMVITKGWCAVSTDGIEKMYGVSVRQLEIGDECLLVDGDKISATKVISIEVIPCSEIFYCLATKETHSFIANGIVVHDVDIKRFSKEYLDREGVKLYCVQK